MFGSLGTCFVLIQAFWLDFYLPLSMLYHQNRSHLFDSPNPPFFKALLIAKLNRKHFQLKSSISFFLGLDEIGFFWLPKFKITWLFFIYLRNYTLFRQRYIYLLKLVRSQVMVMTHILVLNLGLFSIDKWNINKFVLCSL